jgi:hypothetical protein
MTRLIENSGFLIKVGLVCMVLGGILGVFLWSSAALPQRYVHFTTGFFCGIAIVFLIAGTGMKARQRSTNAHGPCA